MRLIGNLIWFVFGGFIHSLIWALWGILFSITVIGIPVGIQCFKMAGLQLAPFGKRVEYRSSGVTGMLANILWILFCGWELAVANLISAAFFAVTIIGIPFAVQSLKMAQLSLMPFGTEVVREHIF